MSHFKAFYNDENLNINESLKNGRSKILVENGIILEKSKDKDGNISEKVITENWHDWIDYWSVDFDYESKKEFIKIQNEKVALKNNGLEIMSLRMNGNHSG